MGAFFPLLLLAVAANGARLVVPSHGLNQDGLHLLDAKHALTVPDGALADWDPRDATPCGWTGVSCDAGAVTGVSLAGANLVGPFPGALCRIPGLASLDLGTNYIGPDVAVAGCKALARLDLSMNSFVGGPLPDSLAAGDTMAPFPTAATAAQLPTAVRAREVLCVSRRSVASRA